MSIGNKYKVVEERGKRGSRDEGDKEGDGWNIQKWGEGKERQRGEEGWRSKKKRGREEEEREMKKDKRQKLASFERAF